MKSSILPQLGNVTYIISGDTATESHHQLLIQALAGDLARGYFDSVTVCRGQYKGTPERSIAVTGWNSEATYECLLSLGRWLGQESILRVNTFGYGSLIFCQDESEEQIGKYTSIDSTNGHEAWSEVCATGETFTFA